MKKILYIIGLTLCLVLAFEKSYGQGWERPLNFSNSFYLNVEDDLFPLKDGGLITSDFGYNYSTATNSGIYINRFDKYGNVIWDRKSFYTFNPFCEWDSVTQNFYNCNYDTFSIAGACQVVQLPNNNLVIEHLGQASSDINSKYDLRYFTIVDNYGNFIKRVHNNNDTILLQDYAAGGIGNYEKMFYNENNNTIECINFHTVGKDSIWFIKTVFDTNLVKISSFQKLNIRPNLLNYRTSTLFGDGLTFFKSKNGNCYWYDVQDNNSAYSSSKIIKFDSTGRLVYDTLISLITLKNTIRPSIPNVYNDNFNINDASSEIDITENGRNETTFGIRVRCYFDTIITDPLFIGNRTRFKTKYVLYTLDSIGAIKYSNVIESIYDSTSISFSAPYTHPLFVKNISDDTLLVLAVNEGYDSTQYPNGFPWEAIKININTNQIFSQKFIYTTGYNHQYQYWKGQPQIKRYTKDEKYMFLNFLYTNNSNVGIAKIDNNGYAFQNAVTGNVFNDANNNCAKNTLEKGLPNYTVTATKDNYNNFGTTDRNGNYVIGLADSGNYTVAVRPSQNYPLWNPVCNPSQSITVENNIAFDTVNFAMKPSMSCVFNTVNISNVSPFRIGQASTYYISYCNNGTIASTNTYITVKLDSLLDINSSTLTYTSLPNNTYRFNIGTLDFLNCGNFSFVATPRIGAVQLNQTLCAEAHIYPDTICTTPNYTGAFIEASARCLGDSLQFKLQNIGIGNMPTVKKYIVIEDNVLRINKNYQLNAGQLLTETIKADSGSTYRIIAEQPDDLPLSYGDKFATAAVENCQPIRTGFNTGFFTQFPNYDGEPYRAVSCNVITGAFDPNDKVASPTGYASQHYIEKNTPIDYQINFQNTGNDTAFKVVVVDTIAPTLDINSIQLGVASHRYQFQRTDSNVVQFVFDSIMLVDSFKNERLSHGFVKFKIQQKANNANGTKIYNKAAIYFDYNLPIITNQTYHTVGQNFVQVNLLSDVNSTKLKVKAVKVFPNPFRDKTQIIVDSDLLKEAVLLLMTIDGKIIKTIPSTTTNSFDIYREDLSNGMYLFKIIQNQETVASGKLVVQ